MLARKPGALRNGAPFQDWALPPAPDQAAARLGSGDEADRQFRAGAVGGARPMDLDAVEDAVREALEGGSASDDVILNILAAAASRPPGGDHHL